jgi:Sulfotransferase domain
MELSDVKLSRVPGTTWTQEMVWLIVNNCDFEAAKQKSLNERAPFLESVIWRISIDENSLNLIHAQVGLLFARRYNTASFKRSRRLVQTAISARHQDPPATLPSPPEITR